VKRPKARDKGRWASTKGKLAAKVGVTRSTIALWEDRGGFPQPGPDGWDVEEVRRWRDATMAPQGRRRREPGDEDSGGVRGDLLQAQADERRAKADLANLRLQIEKGLFHKHEDVVAFIASGSAVVKRGLLSLGKSLAPLLVGQDQRTIELLIHRRARELLSRIAKFGKRGT